MAPFIYKESESPVYL